MTSLEINVRFPVALACVLLLAVALVLMWRGFTRGGR